MTAATVRTAAVDGSGVAVDDRRRVGRALLGAAATWVFYIAVIATTSAGYEEALQEVSDDTGAAVSRLPAETLAGIVHDHPWSNLANLVLVLLPVTLVVVARRVAAVTGRRAPVAFAWAAAAVWGSYLLLQLGLLADPDSLPPLTRDLDVLTVPFVSAGSVVSTAAFLLAALALRRHGHRPVASLVAAAAASLLLLVMAVTLVTSGFDEPIAPIGLFPAELVLGIALLVGTRRREPAPHRSA